MKLNNLPKKLWPEALFLSLFGVGFLPVFPGTYGSAVTLPLLYFISYFQVPLFLLIPFFFILLLGGSVISHYVCKSQNIEDPGWIVIDELLGMIVTWIFYPTHNIYLLCIAFAFFRLFDIKKPWPINLVDQKIKNGFGVMADDLVAGIYAGICYLIFTKFLLLIIPTFS